MDWHLVIGILSGLGFLEGSPEFQTLLRTALATNICFGFLCRVIAKNCGKNPSGWMLAGLVFGPWALMILIFRIRRGAKEPVGS